MALNVKQVIYDPTFASQIDLEYICTGYMFDIDETKIKTLEIAEGGDFMAGQLLMGQIISGPSAGQITPFAGEGATFIAQAQLEAFQKTQGGY